MDNNTEAYIAYIGTIWEFIQGMNEDEVRELIEDDIKMMDEEWAEFTRDHFEEIVAEAMRELED